MAKGELHPRNKHRDRYDFKALTEALPALAPFVIKTPSGEDTVNFADPSAVKTLNRALLKKYYNIGVWGMPPGYLCPPIPGRADYIHHLSELLSDCNRGAIPRGPHIKILDVGVGANCIYPIIGWREYGWNFVGSDIDAAALASAANILRGNQGLADAVTLRPQPQAANIFRGVVREGELFDACICNPPFHKSREEAAEGTRRKLDNLGLAGATAEKPPLNFEGKDNELWCLGGETGFARRMILESKKFQASVFWFTTLISKESNLPDVYHELRRAGVADRRTIVMSQGHKVSRIVAWTYFDKSRQEAWRRRLADAKPAA